ncbi:MAG: hypothetical protein VX498_13670 [Myxococcota bacterium]|nr:hypothetical protein [Myxococcota bacterium]
MDSAVLLERLRDTSDEGQTAQLAALVVEDLLNRPLSDVVEAERTASILGEVLRDWLRSDRGEQRLLEAWGEAIESIRDEERSLQEIAPPEVREAVEELAAQHYSPDRALLLAILDRKAVRELFRELLSDTLTSFGKRLLAAGPGSRLGGLGKRGGGLKRPKGGLLGLAGDVASKVSGEVERQLDRRIPEFVDSALSTVLQRFVELLSAPERASEQAELRLALLQGLWERSGPELAAELARLDSEATAAVLRRSLTAWVERDEFVDQVSGWISGLVEEYGDLHLRKVLEDLDLLSSFEEHGTEICREAALRLFETEAFGDWLAQLTEP